MIAAAKERQQKRLQLAAYDLRRYRILISEDPIGLAGGINPYVYAQNDPVNNSDPLGLQPPEEDERMCTIKWRVYDRGGPNERWDLVGVICDPQQTGPGTTAQSPPIRRTPQCQGLLAEPFMRSLMNEVWQRGVRAGARREIGAWVSENPFNVWWTQPGPPTAQRGGLNPGRRRTDVFIHTHPNPERNWSQVLSPLDVRWANANAVTIISVARDTLSVYQPGGVIQACGR